MISVGHIFQASQIALFATTSGECKTPVLDKLFDHSYHVFVSRSLSSLIAGETTMLDSASATGRCHIYKHGTGLFASKQSSMFWVSKTARSAVDLLYRNHLAQQGAVKR